MDAPDENTLRELAAADTGFGAAMGIELLEVGPDGAVLTWTVGPQHLQPWGIPHGGMHCAVHEQAASIAGQTWLADRGVIVGTHNATDFIRQATVGMRLVATARPVHRGRSQQLWEVETRDPDDRLVARGQVRLANLDGDPRPVAARG